MDYRKLARLLPKRYKGVVNDFQRMIAKYPTEMNRIKKLMDDAARTNDADKYKQAMDMYQCLLDSEKR